MPDAVATTSPVAELPHPDATIHEGNFYLYEATGRMVPFESVKAVDLLMDELVRSVAGEADALSAEIANFKLQAFDRIDSFMALVAQEHGAKLGGKKGNLTLTAFNGLTKVQVQVAEHIDFGPELTAAKSLVDECLRDWSSDANAHLRTIVESAFNVNKEGKINTAELLKLTRHEIGDERWKRAMNAIREAMRVIGSKRYVRIYRRKTVDGAWRPVTLDVAAA